MSNNNRLFVDGISDVSLINGMIHITCANLSKPKDGEGEPKVEDTVRLALPIGGFAQSLQHLNSMMDILKDRGILDDQSKVISEKLDAGTADAAE